MTPAPAAAPYTRQEFDTLREARRRIERRESGLLALVSVLLGLGQLALIGWLDSHVERGRAVAIEGTLFLLYMALVGWLLWRMLRRVGAARLRCPACRVPLSAMSERVATATGRCDACGGAVLAGAA